MKSTLLVGVVVFFCVTNPAKAQFLYTDAADTIGGQQAAKANYAQYTLGNKFTVGFEDLQVTKLGYADLNKGDGLIDSHKVGIWKAVGTLFGSATVPAGSSAKNVNGFRYVALDSAITLQANQTYVIAGDTAGAKPSANDYYRLGPSYSHGYGIASHIGRIQSPQGAGFTFPTSAPITSAAWGIVNMEFTTAPLVLPATPGPAVKQWTLATQDTSLRIGLDSAAAPAIYALNNPTQKFNWMQQPCSIQLPTSVVQNGQNVATDWQLQNAIIDDSSGTKLTLQFTSATTGLEFKSQWWARPGRGPIHHASFITNGGSGPIEISYQPTFAFNVTAPQSEEVFAWHFKSDGGGYHEIEPVGVYREPITSSFRRAVTTSPDGPRGDAIPLAIIDAGGSQGVYVGTEWSYGLIQIAASDSKSVSIRSGNVPNFKTTLKAGQSFEVPPGFVGAYKGDVDDAGNGLRKYLLNYNMPVVLRDDATYPKVQWNAFGATGKVPNGWDPVGSKYYPLIDDMAKLGFEEVMIDVGWWQNHEPDADKQDWPLGMKSAADYAKQKGIRFGLYWTDKADMATAAGRQTRAKRIKRLFDEYGARMWRSDSTHGPVFCADYWSVKGFYDMLDGLAGDIPNFQWENCSGGGRIKDYGAMKRSVKIFNADTYAELDVRRVFYDSSFAMHPMQLEGHLGCLPPDFRQLRPRGAAGMKYAFRTMSMGAPEWFLDAPNGGNGSDPWTDEEKKAVASAVVTYKQKIRPLVRDANMYHIFPRPDGIAWDGLEYYDPKTKKGGVYIFKPKSPNDTQRIVFKGLDPEVMYQLTFEDGSNPTQKMLGADLMKVGVDVTLRGTKVSELMFIEAAK